MKRILFGVIGALVLLLGFQQWKTEGAVTRSNELADSLIASEAIAAGLETRVATVASDLQELLSDHSSLSAEFRAQGDRLAALGAQQATLSRAHVSLTDSVNALADVKIDTVYLADSTPIEVVTELRTRFDDGTLISNIHCLIPQRECSQLYSLNILLDLLHVQGPGGSMIATAESPNPNVNFVFDELRWVPPQSDDPLCGSSCKKIVGGVVILAAALAYGDEVIGWISNAL